MITTKLRIALTAAALCAASSAADAKPRRVVVLDFDGPRSLVDASRSAVVTVLTEQYDIVKKKTWEDARSRASKSAWGPQTWNKAAKASGVDAVVEGWVQDEGRTKMLNIIVREASTGKEFDTLQFKIGKAGFSEEQLGLVRSGLEDVLSFIEPGLDPSPRNLPDVDPRRRIDGPRRDVDIETQHVKKPRHAEAEEIELEQDAEPAEKTEKPEKASEKTEVATAGDIDKRDETDLAALFGNKTDEWPLPKKPNHVPQPTPRFLIGLGGYYSSRSLTFESEDPQDFLGVSTKGLSVGAAVYPFPVKKKDGQLSGVGFAVNIYKAPASTVTVQGDDVVADYKIDSGGFDASVHYRYPITDIIHIDGHVGYAQEYFNLEQDIELDVPDVGYKYFWGGFNLDLNITDRASVGFGAKYLYVTDNGQMSELDWYGPGSASGYALDGNFVIPLPARLYVRGEINYKAITTEFDAPDLSAEEARSADDSTVNGTVHVGIQF